MSETHAVSAGFMDRRAPIMGHILSAHRILGLYGQVIVDK
jgi:hypothetical protein